MEKILFLSSKSKFQATSAQFMYFKFMVEPGNMSVQMTCWKTDAIMFFLSHLLPKVNNGRCTQTPELINLPISLEAGKNSITQACQKESKEGVLKICSFENKSAAKSAAFYSFFMFLKTKCQNQTTLS